MPCETLHAFRCHNEHQLRHVKVKAKASITRPRPAFMVLKARARPSTNTSAWCIVLFKLKLVLCFRLNK